MATTDRPVEMTMWCPASATAPDLTADLDYAWLCGESGLATSLRRHLVQEVGMDKRSITFSGYWKLGAARG